MIEFLWAVGPLLLSCLALALGLWSNRRPIKSQARAYDYAADVMAREFRIETAARRVLATWDLDAAELPRELGELQHALAAPTARLRA